MERNLIWIAVETFEADFYAPIFRIGQIIRVLPCMSIIEKIETKENALTVEELATIVSQSPKTLYKAVKTGRLPAYRIGGSIRLDPHDVAEWLRDRRTR